MSPLFLVFELVMGALFALCLRLYFIGAGLCTGVILQPPALLLVSLAMLGLTRWLHRGDLAALMGRRQH
jgi:hypothetical protein